MDNSLPCVEEVQKLPAALQREWAHWMITEAAGRSRDISNRHMEALLELVQGETGKRLDLPYGLVAGRDYDRLWMPIKGSERRRYGGIRRAIC